MKKNRRLWSILLAVLMTLTVVGCAVSPEPEGTAGATEQVQTEAEGLSQLQEEDKPASYPMTIVDSYGREVVIEKEPAKVISIAPSITETIFALRKENILVARTDYCDYPAEVSGIESIGSLREPNIEKIVELQPDLVIVSTHFKQEVLEKLEELNIPVIGFYGDENFDGVYHTIRQVGKVLDAETEAESIVADMEQIVEDVQNKVKGLERPSLYYVVGFGQYGDYTAGGDTFIHQMIEMAGGENAAGDVDGWQYSLEKLVEKDPDILVCSVFYDSKAGIESANGYMDLTAVKEGRLFEIDNNLLDRQGPRQAQGLLALARILHPEVFE